MKRKQGERFPCDACGKPLIAARTKDGKLAPVTADVQLGGNVLVFQLTGVECRTFGGKVLEKLHAEGVPLRLNHFADCPQADRFKRAWKRDAN